MVGRRLRDEENSCMGERGISPFCVEVDLEDEHTIHCASNRTCCTTDWKRLKSIEGQTAFHIMDRPASVADYAWQERVPTTYRRAMGQREADGLITLRNSKKAVVKTRLRSSWSDSLEHRRGTYYGTHPY
ncbi:hypothetical protein N7530_004500 [Penicillium desertorum]|uniref:Uncharacterized protein n=1 Tax=Penicillium desertorum TaxID=1303715 RepID=A0A9W9WYC2_9EURO|nr:hypothetical protein N7530_004500 [Penicillium desertorum]